MGLSVEVGLLSLMLADGEDDGADHLRKKFAACNRLLAARGLPTHNEPESLPSLRSRAKITSFSYSSIHHLRLAYAHRLLDADWLATTSDRQARASQDPVLRGADKEKKSHLLWHSDAEGFYLPIDFERLLVNKTLPGLVLCSTHRLMEELKFVAPAIGVHLQNGLLSDQESAAINSRVDGEEGPHIEQMVWIALYEAARLSVEYKSAIVFT